MDCLIIEDEKIAAERLQEMIVQIDPEIQVLSVIQTVKQSVQWLNTYPAPDLIFMDIQLADGLSFEVFEQTPVHSPVIFTTAYDEYALRAFKVNSIDYLLKPIDRQELQHAIERFKNTNKPKQYPQAMFDSLLKNLTNNYKSKFMIKVGEHLKVFTSEDIYCFCSMDKAVFLKNKNGRDYAVNYTLDQLEELLNPATFFRVNRKYIVAFAAIQDIITFSNSRLQLRLHTPVDDDIVVSREKVQAFKEWLES